MIIKILSLGKFKVNQKFKSIFEYYQKRIKFKTVLIELKTYKNNRKKELEKGEILKLIKNQDHNNVFVLDKSGKNFSSLEFADVLNNKIGIVGLGVLGSAIAECFINKKNNILGYDLSDKFYKNLNKTIK